MDGHDLDIPSDHLLSCIDMTSTQSNCSFDIDEFLTRTEPSNDILGRTRACTHAHACNQPGPDKSHTHTCIHVHTQIMPTSNEFEAQSDDSEQSVDKKPKKRRVLGNREAVRKYREKKKAKTASLEDEVLRLRALNGQLMKRLEGRALLEAEVARLKCLLVDIRGRIEGEIGSFPYHNKLVKTGDVYENVADPNVNVNFSCNDQVYCNGQGIGDCGFDNLDCLRNQNCGPDCGFKNVSDVSIGKTSRKRKGA